MGLNGIVTPLPKRKKKIRYEKIKPFKIKFQDDIDEFGKIRRCNGAIRFLGIKSSDIHRAFHNLSFVIYPCFAKNSLV